MGHKQEKLGAGSQTVRVPADLVKRIDAFRDEQRIRPSRSAAFRYVLNAGFAALAAKHKTGDVGR